MSNDSLISHPLLSTEVLQSYVAFFKAIDNSINLYYLSHTTPPTLEEILISSSNLLNKRILKNDFSVLLAIYPGCYTIEENSKVNSNAEFLISLPFELRTFNSLIPKRVEEFTRLLNLWVSENPESKNLPKVQLLPERKSRTSNLASPSPSKITKPRLSNELRNSSEKFKFKERDEKVEQEKNGGLTLLERIRLKEKRNKELALADNSETRYSSYITGKLPHIYDILYQTVNQDDSLRSFPLGKFIDIVCDSLNYPISKQEIEDIINALAKSLGPEKVNVITRANITVMKINNLDRQVDIKTLKTKK